jgi:hypothetical protein
MKIVYSVLLCFCLTACNDPSNDPSKDQVIVTYDGRMKISNVSKFGPYCYLEWYGGIDSVAMHADGTAHDGNLKYTWRPLERDKWDDLSYIWNRNACREPT